MPGLCTSYYMQIAALYLSPEREPPSLKNGTPSSPTQSHSSIYYWILCFSAGGTDLMASVLKERPWWSAGCRSVSDRELCEGIANDFHVV